MNRNLLGEMYLCVSITTTIKTEYRIGIPNNTLSHYKAVIGIMYHLWAIIDRQSQLGAKKKLGRGLAVHGALPAAPVYLEPMPAQLEPVAGRSVYEHVLDVAAGEVLRGAAVNA